MLRRSIRCALAGLLLALVAASPAAAARPTALELPLTVDGVHVRVHYSSATATEAYAQAGLADLEEAWSRLVAGAGGTPNAALRAPISDGSLGGNGLVDAYLAAPPGGGGQVFWDTPTAHASGWIQLDPALGRAAFRFRAAHELMHVVQGAYTTALTLASESTANWAAEFSLPDVEAADNRFDHPGIPLDCAYGTWRGVDCGSGYAGWLFVEHLAEGLGADVVDAYLAKVEQVCPNCVSLTNQLDRRALRETIAAQAAGATLSSSFAAYARRVWQPTAWTTTAVGTITGLFGAPASTAVSPTPSAPDTGTHAVSIDHLAAAYVRIATAGTEPSGPDDRYRVTATKPADVSPPSLLVRDATSGVRTEVPLSASCGGAPCATVSADRARVADVVLVLANDLDPATDPTTADDARPFGWRVELLPGTPTPPANDGPAGAVALGLDEQGATDTAYASGSGDVEAPGCARTAGATRGVWFAFTAPNGGTYRFDASGSDFAPGVALRHAALGTFLGCLGNDEGVMSAPMLRGATYLVYVGRRAGSTALGRTARLVVTGPPAPAPEPTPPPTEPPPPAPAPDTTAPLVPIASAALALTAKGTIAVRLSCPAAEAAPCVGRVSIATAARIAARLAGGRKRVVSLGSAAFEVPVGRTRAVVVGVPARGRTVVAALRRVPVIVTARARDAAGNVGTTTRRVVVTAPARRA